VLAVAPGPLSRRSVDAVRPFALGLTAMLSALALAAPAAHAAVPDRGYELVTPVHKGGNDLYDASQVTADGNALTFTTLGTYGDATSSVFVTSYVTRRGPDGWTPQVLSPTPIEQAPNLFSATSGIDITADMSTFFFAVSAGTHLSPDDADAAADVYARRGDQITLLTGGIDDDTLYAGRSADGSHVVVDAQPSGLTTRQVYENVAGTTRHVSVLPDGTTPPSASAGAGRADYYLSAPADPHAVSADGSRIFFGAGGQLYVRLDGASTRLVSASQRAGSVGDPAATTATFDEASRDGDRVFFHTTSQLTDDAPTGGGVYVYTVSSGVLRWAAGPATSWSGPVRATADGSRFFFVSRSVAVVPGQGTVNRPNLYVTGPDGPRFVGTLTTADDELWTGGAGLTPVALSPDQRRLAFAATAKLTAYDNAGKSEVYIYDTVDETLVCASCPDGDPATGDAALQAPNPYGALGSVMPRSFGSDGTLYFQTAQSLAADDVNDATDVYAFDGTTTHLLSSGTGTEGAFYVDNSADGSDVFLRTRESLVPADTDRGVMDIYDARRGAVVVTPPAPCSGSVCRGVPSPDPATPAAPASATTFDAGGTPDAAPAPTFTVGAISATSRRRWASTGKLSLRVRVSEAAIVTAKGRATIGKKAVTVASGSGQRTSAGTTTLTLKLTTAARRALRRSGRLTIRLTVRCSDTSRTSVATVVLLRAKASR
jgi:hypothetical protein